MIGTLIGKMPSTKLGCIMHVCVLCDMCKVKGIIKHENLLKIFNG
jgi:hypothetical protein